MAAILNLDGTIFKDGQKVSFKQDGLKYNADIVYRPYNSHYPISKMGWYIRGWCLNLFPIESEQFTELNPISDGGN